MITTESPSWPEFNAMDEIDGAAEAMQAIYLSGIDRIQRMGDEWGEWRSNLGGGERQTDRQTERQIWKEGRKEGMEVGLWRNGYGDGRDRRRKGKEGERGGKDMEIGKDDDVPLSHIILY